MAARDWSVAHGLFTAQLASRWWTAGDNTERLRAALAQLTAEAAAVEAAVGAPAWKAGAGLYHAYFRLQVITSLMSFTTCILAM